MSVPGPDSLDLILSRTRVLYYLILLFSTKDRLLRLKPFHRSYLLHNISMNSYVPKKLPKDASFYLSHLPKRLQIYNCFYSRQAFSKKNKTSFQRTGNKHRNTKQQYELSPVRTTSRNPFEGCKCTHVF